jgi:hypothetical protein
MKKCIYFISNLLYTIASTTHSSAGRAVAS